MKNDPCLLLILSILLCIPICPLVSTSVQAGAVTLQATLLEDTYAQSSTPDTNYDGSALEIYVRNYSSIGRVGLVQFALPQLPSGSSTADIVDVKLAGVSAFQHSSYRNMSLEVLGLSVNPDLTTVTYNDLLDSGGNGVITSYDVSTNFTYGSQATSLDLMSFNTSSTPVGAALAFPDQSDNLLDFVRNNISPTQPTTVTLAIGPGDSAVGNCDFRFYAMENTAGADPMSLTLDIVPEPSTTLLLFMAFGSLLVWRRVR